LENVVASLAFSTTERDAGENKEARRSARCFSGASIPLTLSSFALPEFCPRSKEKKN